MTQVRALTRERFRFGRVACGEQEVAGHRVFVSERALGHGVHTVSRRNEQPARGCERLSAEQVTARGQLLCPGRVLLDAIGLALGSVISSGD